jgi:hypothetical protein
MSQDVSTNSSVLDDVFDEPSLDLDSEAPPQEYRADGVDLVGEDTLPMDYYANSLMDDLFAEVDRMLEGGSLPSETPAPPEVVSLQPIAIPRLNLPSMRLQSELALVESEAALATQPDDYEAIATLEPSAAESRGIDRWLLAAVCASAIASAVSWLVFFRPVAPPVVPTSTELPPADQQFLSYVQRALDRIDSRTAASQTAASPSTALPSVAVASSVPAPGASPPVLERVYVPVYQPPQTLYPPAPVPPVAVAPAAPSVAIAPAAPRSTAPATPRPAAPAAPQPAAPAPVAVAPAAPTTPHLLIGLLQLGDRSAALFEVNGASQRIYIGESIGSSGWTLVSVSNQEAVIRRNGEVRSIFVGQQF